MPFEAGGIFVSELPRVNSVNVIRKESNADGIRAIKEIVMTYVVMTRDEFRNGVFQRDHGRCVVCEAQAVDAHHIIERRLWPDGGYYLDNGVSVCEHCHIQAEMTKISCEDLRKLCDIRVTLLPPHLCPDSRWDKWGNPYMEDGTDRRYIGELYYDESLVKLFTQAGIYDDPMHFVKCVKYPRTYHLPWSPGGTNDDRRIDTAMASHILNREIVVTVKMDGENCNMYSHAIHARSLDSGTPADRNWVKNLWSQFAHDIPPGWRLCGENMFATHSLYYSDLPSYFLLFSIWNERNDCLSWDDTVEWSKLLGLRLVPTVFRGVPRDGMWGELSIQEGLLQDLQSAPYRPYEHSHEGYVIRPADKFAFRDFRKLVGKYVRKDHVVEHARHWRRRAIEKNQLGGDHESE